MKVTNDLEELLRRIRLDHEEIVERFRFSTGVPKMPSDSVQQLSTWPQLNRLSSIICTVTWRTSPRRLRYLCAGGHRTFEAQPGRVLPVFVGGPYDDTYVNGRLRIGVIHQQVGLELKWYLVATVFTWTTCLKACSATAKTPRSIRVC
jgi:hypothetical protein